MKHLLTLIILLLVAPAAAATSCMFVPLEEQLREADTVFVATVTSASSDGPFASFENGSDYRVNYRYTVRERIKGDPTTVTSLFTVNMYHAYDSDLHIQGDETRLLPGDNVLVISSATGDVQVASCTPSRLWSPSADQLRLLRSGAL